MLREQDSFSQPGLTFIGQGLKLDEQGLNMFQSGLTLSESKTLPYLNKKTEAESTGFRRDSSTFYLYCVESENFFLASSSANAESLCGYFVLPMIW